MPAPALTAQDLDDLRAHGVDEVEARRILQRLQQPPQPVRLVRAAGQEDGVRTLEAVDSLAARFGELDVVAGKFTPMSGAASRMFGFLEKLLVDQAGPAEQDKLQRFLRALDRRQPGPRFAFDDALEAALHARGQDLQALLARGEPRPIIGALLDDDGLGYRRRPKALVPFHRRQGRPVLALEEHLREARAWAGDRLHLTIAPEQRPQFEQALQQIVEQCPELRAVHVDMSVQHPATDSLALDASSGELVRGEDGHLVFFPAGHGSLLRNLQELRHPAVLRNVDNVPAGAAALTEVERQHRALAVRLAELKRELGRLLRGLDDGTLPTPALREGLENLRAQGVNLMLQPMRFARASDDAQRVLAREALDRPIKLAGVVRNQGEPGGGPFVIEQDGLQFVSIVEKDEIAPEQRQFMHDGEFFNPVDLLIDPTDHRGRTVELGRFVNQDRCIVVRKPFRGRELVRLEHPGLWNGAMDGWTSLFVVLPLATFAPVKEVNDLLRPQHQVD